MIILIRSRKCNENKALEVSLKNLVNDMYAKDVSKRVVVTRKQEMERDVLQEPMHHMGIR